MVEALPDETHEGILVKMVTAQRLVVRGVLTQQPHVAISQIEADTEGRLVEGMSQILKMPAQTLLAEFKQMRERMLAANVFSTSEFEKLYLWSAYKHGIEADYVHGLEYRQRIFAKFAITLMTN